MAEASIGAVEEFPEGKPYRVDNAARCAASHVVSDEPGASCSKRSCGATCCAEEHHGMSVSMVSGRKMEFISARACRGKMKARASEKRVGRGLMKGS